MKLNIVYTTEQEITGDVLLELDVTLLKTEIGILAFGKRMRIANAITDLRRPPSITYSDRQGSPHSPMHPNSYSPAIHNPSPRHSRNQSQAPSQSYSYSHGHSQSMQSSAQHSLHGTPSLSSPGFFVLSPESAPRTGDIIGSPGMIGFSMSQTTNGDRETENRTVSDVSGSGEADDRGLVGLGIGIPDSLRSGPVCFLFLSIFLQSSTFHPLL